MWVMQSESSSAPSMPFIWKLTKQPCEHMLLFSTGFFESCNHGCEERPSTNQNVKCLCCEGQQIEPEKKSGRTGPGWTQTCMHNSQLLRFNKPVYIIKCFLKNPPTYLFSLIISFFFSPFAFIYFICFEEGIYFTLFKRHFLFLFFLLCYL